MQHHNERWAISRRPFVFANLRVVQWPECLGAGESPDPINPGNLKFIRRKSIFQIDRSNEKN